MTFPRRLPWLTPTSPMTHEPVSTFLGLTALIEGLGVSAGLAGAIGGGIVSVGLSLGASYAAQALQKRGSGPLENNSAGAINDPAIKYNERQAIPRKRIIYGTAQVGGALFFEAVKPPYLYHGFLVCAEQITAFRKMWVGTNELAFSSLVPNSILAPLVVSGQPNYQGRLRASFRLGLPSQTIDGLLHGDFPNLDASFRQQGIATAVIRYDYGADYNEFTALWGQVQKPNPLFLVDGVAVPDPRVPGCILDWNPNDPDSVANARRSWGFSNNAALVQAHYLTQRYGGRIDPGRMNWDKVARAAEWDDGLVYCLDGTFQKRYTIDGVVTLNQSPSDVLSGMIAADRGFVLESAGRVWVSSSEPRQPVVTIHDGVLTGAVSIRQAKPKRDLVNRVKTRFVAPDREYQQADGPVLARSDLQAEDGEVLDATLNLPLTLDDRRAQRLAKAFLLNSRLGRQITCRCDVALLTNCKDELIGSSVRWNSKLFPQGDGIYFVTDWGFSDGFASIDIFLIEYDPSIESNWSADEDEKPFELANLDVS